MKKIITAALSALMLASCSDNILDITPSDRISDDIVWTDANLTKAYLTNLYNAIPHGFKIHMQSKMTDEACCTIDWGAGIISHGTLTPDNVTSVSTGDWTGGGNLYTWNDAFKYVRQINILLDKLGTDDNTLDGKERMMAEAKFIRAFIYFDLYARYGEAPIVETYYEMSDSTKFSSNKGDEVVTFIEKNINEAMPHLPKSYSADNPEFGRATQAACQALLSRLYLYAASPLFNTSGDKGKWQKAADAAKMFIDTYTDFALYPDYRSLFNQPSGSANSEIIFARTFTTTNGHNTPMNNLGRRYGAYGGWWASNGPTQNLVDDYDMANGEPPFIWKNGEKSINPESGYDPENPYANRDPRLDATVLHDNSVFHGDTLAMWVASDESSWGYDNYRQSTDNPTSNYVMRKFMPEDGELSWQATYTQPWIHFRLAEIYLNYAEAEFELGHEDVSREYINKVRARAGMPALDASVTGETLRTRLYNEHRVEFAFEEHRYFDVRRWKVAEEIENRPAYGMEIIKNVNTGKKTYNPLVIVKRSFDKKMYFLPISTTEIRKNQGRMQQTSTWR